MPQLYARCKHSVRAAAASSKKRKVCYLEFRSASKEDIQEVNVSLANAKEISMDAAVEAVDTGWHFLFKRMINCVFFLYPDDLWQHFS